MEKMWVPQILQTETVWDLEAWDLEMVPGLRYGDLESSGC